MTLVVWALDSADIDLLQRCTADGSLPNIAALWKNSRVSPLGGPGWFDETGTWVTALSGVPQTLHGYIGARRLKPGTYTLERMRMAQANARPCWREMQRSGFRALIWEPSEGVPIPGLDGTQVFNLTVHQEAFAMDPPVTVPDNFLETLRSRFGTPRRLRFNLFDKPVEYYQSFLQDNLDLFERKSRIVRDLVRDGRHDLIVIGFNEIHDAGHLLWSFMDGRSPARDPKGLLSGAVLKIYQRIDREIGAIQEILPPGSAVCLLSTYGMLDQYPTLGLAESFMSRLGYQVPHSGPPRDNGALGVARKLVPETLRYEISKRLPSATQQRLLFSAFASATDFTRSRAFVIPTSLYVSQIRVNLKGREPSGIVAPGPDYLAFLDELENDLRQLIDPVTGQPAVERILRPAGYHIDGPSQLLPDLYVHWKPVRHFVSRVIHPRAEISQRKSGFHRDSFHRKPGFAAFSGPGIQPCFHPAEACLLDIAPTLLDLAGVAPTHSLLGRSLLQPVPCAS